MLHKFNFLDYYKYKLFVLIISTFQKFIINKMEKNILIKFKKL